MLKFSIKIAVWTIVVMSLMIDCAFSLEKKRNSLDVSSERIPCYDVAPVMWCKMIKNGKKVKNYKYNRAISEDEFRKYRQKCHDFKSPEKNQSPSETIIGFNMEIGKYSAIYKGKKCQDMYRQFVMMCVCTYDGIVIEAVRGKIVTLQCRPGARGTGRCFFIKSGNNIIYKEEKIHKVDPEPTELLH